MTDLHVEWTFRGIDEAIDSMTEEPLDVDEFAEFFEEATPTTIGVANVELETETEMMENKPMFKLGQSKEDRMDSEQNNLVVRFADDYDMDSIKCGSTRSIGHFLHIYNRENQNDHIMTVNIRYVKDIQPIRDEDDD